MNAWQVDVLLEELRLFMQAVKKKYTDIREV